MYIKQILFSVCVVTGMAGSAVWALDDDSLDNYDVEIIRNHESSTAKSGDDGIVVGSTSYREKGSSDGKSSAPSSSESSTSSSQNASSDEWDTEQGVSVTAKDTEPRTPVNTENSTSGRSLGMGCSRPENIPDVTVDTPKIKRIDLTEVSTVYTVVKGDTVGKLIGELAPQGADVTSGQLLAAIARANPKTFNGGNLQIGSKLAVPSAERIALESDKVGKDILSRINAGKMAGYSIPRLQLPWEEEDARIAKQKAAKAARDETLKKQQDDYQACLDAVKRKKEEAELKKAKELEEARKEAERKAREEWEMENTEADLASDDFMIADPEEEAAAKAAKEREENIVLNEQGKRVIVLKQNKDSDKAGNNTAASAGGRISGANIIFNGNDVYARDSSGRTVKNTEGAASASSAELDRMRKELADAQNVNQALLNEKIRQTEKISRLEEQFEGLSSKIDNIAQMQTMQITDAAEARQAREQSQSEEGSTSWLIWIAGIFGGVILYGIVLVPMLRNNRKLREKLQSSVYGRVIIDNPVVRRCHDIKVKIRSSLKKFLEDSEQKELEIGERIAEEERQKAEQEQIEAKKGAVFFKEQETNEADVSNVGSTDVNAESSVEEVLPQEVKAEPEYQPTSMVIEIESDPVVPVGFSEEDQLEVPPSVSHDDDIVATTENPEPKTVD